MNVDTLHLSRPSSSLSQTSNGLTLPHNGHLHASATSDLNTASSQQTTLTPRNVKQWADYQAAIVSSNEGGYEVQEPMQGHHHHHHQPSALVAHLDTAYSTAYTSSPAGLEIGHPPTMAYTYMPLQHDTQEGIQVIRVQTPWRPGSSLDTHPNPQPSIMGFSPSSNELGSPLTWSPDSGHTEAHNPASLQHAAVPFSQSGLSIDTPPTVLYSPVPESGEDYDATLKRGSYNPTTQNSQLGSYLSPESSLGHRSASTSPAPPVNTAQWRRPPLPFANDQSTSSSGGLYDASDHFNTSYPPPPAGQPSLLSQSMPSISRESAGTPQVTLSPAFQDVNSTRPWSPGDYLVYNGSPSQTPLPPSTANSTCSSSYGSQAQLYSHQRSVSPQNALLAPHPIHTHQNTFPVVGRLSPDQYPYTHSFSQQQQQQQRHYSNSSQMSASSLSAFRVQHQPHLQLYRDPQYSPLGSSVGSYHSSESADEGDNGSGASSYGAARSPSSNLGFSPIANPNTGGVGFAGSPYASQSFFFNNMQLNSPDQSVTRPSSSLSNYSVSCQNPPQYSASYQATAGQSASQPSLQRSVSLTVPRRPSSAVRNFSHPYQSVYEQFTRPQSAQAKREDVYETLDSPAWRSTPDLTVETSQRAGADWVFPSEEDVKFAAMQYASPAMGMENNDGDQQLHHFGTGQKTVTARKNTRSSSKSGGKVSTMFAEYSADIDVPSADDSQAVQSTSVGHPSSGRLGYPTSAINLACLDKLPVSGKVIPGRHGSSMMLLGQTLLPLHMLPTKRSRGRRPVVSPDLDIADTIESTIASTLDQVSFTGVTKTGKPKKIFVCRVPGCDKCFRRSEHLKRHIRSIHTHDKPFACAFPTCTKAFARFDNLKQHQKNIHIGWTPPAMTRHEHEHQEDDDESLSQQGSQPDSTQLG